MYSNFGALFCKSRRHRLLKTMVQNDRPLDLTTQKT